MKNIHAINFIKIVVEGAELEVSKSLRTDITKI
jgi:hypothetical protein